MNPEQRDKLYEASMYGAGGLAATAILMDLLRSHKRREAAKENKQDNAMTLYLPGAGAKGKAASDEGVLKEAGLSHMIVASLLAGGTFYGANTLYKNLRKKQLAQEIEDESQQYIQSLAQMGPGGGKSASSLLEELADGPRAILLLSFLAGGAGTYGVLENTFPKVSEKPRPGAPRKVVVKNFGTLFTDDKPGQELAGRDRQRQKADLDRHDSDREDAAQDPTTKTPEKAFPFAKAASLWFRFGDVDKVKAAAYTALICANREMENNPLALLMGRIIREKSAKQLVRDFESTDLLGVISASKGCSTHFKCASEGQKVAAALMLFGHPLLKASAATLLVGEMHDFDPEMSKAARAVADDYSTAVVATKLASTLLQTTAAAPDFEGMEDAELPEDFYDEDIVEDEGAAELTEVNDPGVDPVDEAVDLLAPTLAGKDKPVDAGQND